MLGLLAGEHGNYACKWWVWELNAPGGDLIYLMARYPKTQVRLIATLVSSPVEAKNRYGVDLSSASGDNIRC